MIYNELFSQYIKINYDYRNYKSSKILKNFYKYMKSVLRFRILFSKYKNFIYKIKNIDINQINEFISFIFSFTKGEYIDIYEGKLQCISGNDYYSLTFINKKANLSLFIYIKSRCIIKYTRDDYTVNTYFNNTLFIDKESTSNFNITEDVFHALQHIFYYSIDGLFNYIGGCYSDKSNDIHKHRGRTI